MIKISYIETVYRKKVGLVILIIKAKSAEPPNFLNSITTPYLVSRLNLD